MAGEICVDRSPHGSPQARVWFCWRLLCQQDQPAGHTSCAERPGAGAAWKTGRGLALQEEELLLARPSRELLWVSGDRAKSISISFKILSELVIGRVVGKEEPTSPKSCRSLWTSLKIGHLPWNSAPSVSAIKHHSPPNKPNPVQLKKAALGEVRMADLFPLGGLSCGWFT